MKEGKTAEKTYLVEVSPINKSSGQELLSYFSTTKITPGTMVKVPVRSSFHKAIALQCRDAKSAKSDIRRAGFILKKIRQSDIFESGISSESISTLEETGRYYAASMGALLSIFIPKLFLEEPDTFLKFPEKKQHLDNAPETVLFQMESDERFGQYRAQVRQSFARGSSVMFIVPTHLEVMFARDNLSKGIEEFVHVFALSGKKSELKKRWSVALSDPHPILFITTPTGLLFPREDFDTIIIERENSRSYRTLARPFIHFRKFIEIWAKKNNYRLIMGDSILSLETLWREKRRDFGESSLIRWRLPAASSVVIDAKRAQNENGRFEIITPELRALISKATSEIDQNSTGRIFLFGARKGLSPTTVCGDCGSVLSCQNCGAPVVLHENNDNSVYICHACGARRESATTCGYCGSWKLVPLGIGTEQIARAVKDLFPKQHVYILDKDHASTDKSAALIAKKFRESGGILVGTELAFFHIESVPYSSLVSVDALFSIPDFGINERIFYLTSRLREMTQKETLIQSRNIGKQVLAWASAGNIVDFVKNEIEEREALLYPPFSIFIKITVPKKDIAKEIPKLKVKFSKWQPDTLRDSLIIRLPRENWPDAELSRELALLPPQYSIKVDPESIL